MNHGVHQQSEHLRLCYEMQFSRCISIISYLDMYDNKVSVWGHFCVLGRRYPPIEGRALKDEEKKWISRCVAKMKNITFNSFFRPPRTFFREFSLKCQKWKFISKKKCFILLACCFNPVFHMQSEGNSPLYNFPWNRRVDILFLNWKQKLV